MIDYSLILTKNYAGKEWSVIGDSYDGIEWKDSSPKPTKEELDSEWPSVQAYVDAHAYIAKRIAEYPSIADQLDYIYHNGVDAWKKDMIDPVKNKYPKG
jgi:hypothetical protein